MLKNIDNIILLKDFYGKLLTTKQQEVLTLYYEEDLSLAEISEHTGSTRQAVHNSIKRATTLLLKYEEKLGEIRRARELQRELEQLMDIVAQATDIDEVRTVLLKKLKNLKDKS